MAVKRLDSASIRAAFNNLDDGDISTERLLNMTADVCGVEIDDVVAALAEEAHKNGRLKEPSP